jgi:hypothetical protein
VRRPWGLGRGGAGTLDRVLRKIPEGSATFQLAVAIFPSGVRENGPLFDSLAGLKKRVREQKRRWPAEKERLSGVAEFKSELPLASGHRRRSYFAFSAAHHGLALSFRLLPTPLPAAGTPPSSEINETIPPPRMPSPARRHGGFSMDSLSHGARASREIRKKRKERLARSLAVDVYPRGLLLPDA